MSSHLKPNLELLLPETEAMDLGFGYQHKFVIFLKFKKFIFLKFKTEHSYDSVNSIL